MEKQAGCGRVSAFASFLITVNMCVRAGYGTGQNCWRNLPTEPPAV